MKLLCVVLNLMLAGACLAAEPKPASPSPVQQPSYEGKALDQWAASAKDKDLLVRLKAAWALENIGVAAVPALGELLKDPDAEVRRTATQGLVRICRPPVKTFREPFRGKELEAREAPFAALTKLGPTAVPGPRGIAGGSE